jgi:hypothetical protein
MSKVTRNGICMGVFVVSVYLFGQICSLHVICKSKEIHE